jgi:hypothetical protein
MGPSQTAANLANYCEGFANFMDMDEKRKKDAVDHEHESYKVRDTIP